jgi:HK97 family phage portal protein
MFGGLLARGLEISKFATYEDYLKVGSKKVWASFKSCDLIGKVLMDTPYKLMRPGGQEVEVSEVGKLLANPNPFETIAEMFYKFVFHIKLTGNSYWPRALYTLNPKRVKIVLDPREGIVGYVYRINGVDVPYEVNEVIHFRNPHPDNDYYGLGDIEAAEDLFHENINRSKWSQQFWKNGASPAGILVCKENITDQVAFDQVKARWKKEYGGSDNSGKMAFLTGDWSFHALGMTAQEMENLEASRFNLESIFQLHGIPLTVAGLDKAANRDTGRQDDLRFRRYTVKPNIKILSDTLQSDLVNGFGQNLTLAFELAGLIDVENITTNYVPWFDRGVASPNDIRELLGLERIDDPLFDQHFINAGLVPFELAGIGNQDATQDQTRAIVQRFLQTSLAPPRANGSPAE